MAQIQHEKSNDLTPQDRINAPANRFIIKKVSDYELQNSAQNSSSLQQTVGKIAAESAEVDRENVQKENLIAESIQSSANDAKSSTAMGALATLPNETSPKVTERKISKFTVLKVDASTLNHANVKTNNLDHTHADKANLVSNENSGLIESNQSKEVKFPVDVDSNQLKKEINLNNNSIIQDETLRESNRDAIKQQQMLATAQASQQANAPQFKSTNENFFVV